MTAGKSNPGCRYGENDSDILEFIQTEMLTARGVQPDDLDCPCSIFHLAKHVSILILIADSGRLGLFAHKLKAGAIMKYDPLVHKRRSIRLRGYDYTQPRECFVTLCTFGRECLPGAIAGGIMGLSEIGEICTGSSISARNEMAIMHKL
jgi:hypothetical protein